MAKFSTPSGNSLCKGTINSDSVIEYAPPSVPVNPAAVRIQQNDWNKSPQNERELNSILKGKKMANIMTLAPMSAKWAQWNIGLSMEKLHIHANEDMHLPSKISKPFDVKAQKYFKTGPTITQNNSTSVAVAKSFATKSTNINTSFTANVTR